MVGLPVNLYLQVSNFIEKNLSVVVVYEAKEGWATILAIIIRDTFRNYAIKEIGIFTKTNLAKIPLYV